MTFLSLFYHKVSSKVWKLKHIALQLAKASWKQLLQCQIEIISIFTKLIQFVGSFCSFTKKYKHFLYFGGCCCKRRISIQINILASVSTVSLSRCSQSLIHYFLISDGNQPDPWLHPTSNSWYFGTIAKSTFLQLCSECW